MVVFRGVAWGVFGHNEDATFAALTQPVPYMQQLQKAEVERLAGHLKVLKENGYRTLGGFEREAARLREDGDFWNDLRKRALDGLGACHEAGPRSMR